MFDMTKMFDASNFSSWQQAASDAMVQSQKTAQTMQKAAQVASEYWQQAAQREMEMAQNSWQESMSAAQELTSAKTIEDLLQIQTSFAQKASTKAVENAQELAELIRKAQTESTEIIVKQMMENFENSSKASK